MIRFVAVRSIFRSDPPRSEEVLEKGRGQLVVLPVGEIGVLGDGVPLHLPREQLVAIRGLRRQAPAAAADEEVDTGSGQHIRKRQPFDGVDTESQCPCLQY